MACHNTTNDFNTMTSSKYSFRTDDQWIFPGTKWCGTGDIAENYNDLGLFRRIDMCCRTHDNCPLIIEGGETKFNLTNTDFHSKVHCSCDDEFYHCLKNVGTIESGMIGCIYFNLIDTQCFKQDYPIIRCLIYEYGLLTERCIIYYKDRSKPKVYQFFDVPFF